MTNPAPQDSPYTPPPASTDAAAAHPGATAPAYPGAAPASPPGRGLSIAGLVLAILVPPVGLILSIIAAVKLGKAGAPKGLAIAGIIVAALLTIAWIVGIILMASLFASIFSVCAELGPGVWEVNGVTYTCS